MSEATEAPEQDFTYTCIDPADVLCAEQCTSLEDCLSCDCAVVPLDAGGPWGQFMDVFFCLLPIFFLIVATIKPNPMATTSSLPLAAFLMYLVRLMYLGSDPLQTNAAVILGLHEALTPLSIMAGAITLFETMEATYCLPYMMREIKTLTAGHVVAELMLIFCFAYMVEGASGFGTPVALGAPMLVSSGHPAMESVVVLLIFNTFATVWGAVGTPIWFGFGGDLELTDDDFLEISQKSAIALAIGSFIIVPWVLCILVPPPMLKANIKFVFAALATCVGPALGIAFVSYEFPSLLGGIIGCAGTAVLISKRVGLQEYHPDEIGGRPLDSIGTTSANSLVFKTSKQQSMSIRSTKSTDEQPEQQQPSSSDEEAETTPPEETHTIANSHGPHQEASVEIELPDQSDQGENGVLRDDKKSTTNGAAPGRGVSFGENGNDDADENDPPITAANNGFSNSIDPTEAHSHTASIRDAVDAHLGPRKEGWKDFILETVGRTFPIWLVVILLILTRISEIGIKEYLQKLEPNFAIYFGTYGAFKLSASIVFQLENILTYPGMRWKYELLYIPFFMPFVFVSLIAMFVYRKDMECKPTDIARTVTGRLTNPAKALLGALVLVQLMLQDETAAPSFILGNVLSDWFSKGFVVICPLLGALGSFFSGSTTVSNLTFGQIQQIAAEAIGVSTTSMLALQAVGASAGNGVCLNNIIAACAVVGIGSGEGKILKQTYKYVLSNTTIATIVMLAFFFRF